MLLADKSTSTPSSYFERCRPVPLIDPPTPILPHRMLILKQSFTGSYPPGLFMVDDEGTLSTTDVKARFVNGKPQAIEARYNMRSQFEWDRFIRFMDR